MLTFADEAKTPLAVPHYNGEIILDGELNESIWSKALKLNLEIEITPSVNGPTPEKTEFFMF